MLANRRSFLKDLGAATFAAGQSALIPMPARKPLQVLVVGAHPGDPEYGCGGTIARYVERNDRVTILYLNRGEKGCAGVSANACRMLGVTAKFAGQIDGESMVDPAAYDVFFALVQGEKPDVVFTHWPVDNHRDHRAASSLAYDAWLKARRSFALYFYEVSDGEDTVLFTPTDYVDIGKTEAKKRSACFAHASQSPQRFYALQSEVMRFRGIESGYRQAEAFVRHRDSGDHLLP